MFAVAYGEDHHNAFVGEPPGGERQRAGRGMVEPLGVVEQHHQRHLLGKIGQQREHSKADQQPILCPGRRLSEGRAQCCCLDVGKRLDVPELFVQQQVQGTESDFRFRFHAADAQHAHIGGEVGRVAQQRGLADAGLALDHDCTAAAAARV
jgi:hypothetical protein